MKDGKGPGLSHPGESQAGWDISGSQVRREQPPASPPNFWTLLCVFIVSELSMNTLREVRFVCMLSC